MTRKQSEILMTNSIVACPRFLTLLETTQCWDFYDHIIYYMKTKKYGVFGI